MKCSNLKTLSNISAWLQLFMCFLIIISYAIQLALDDTATRNERLDTVVLIFLLIFAVAIPILITLLVGIKQNRMLLVGIFLYAAHSLLAIGIVYMIYKFIMGFVHREEITKLFLQLLMASVFIGLEFLLTTPIHMLHSRRHRSVSSGDKKSSLREQAKANC